MAERKDSQAEKRARDDEGTGLEAKRGKNNDSQSVTQTKDKKNKCWHGGRPKEIRAGDADSGTVAEKTRNEQWALLEEELRKICIVLAMNDRHGKNNYGYLYDWARKLRDFLPLSKQKFEQIMAKMDSGTPDPDQVFVYGTPNITKQHSIVLKNEDGSVANFALYPIKPYMQLQLPIQWYRDNIADDVGKNSKALVLSIGWLYIAPVCKLQARKAVMNTDGWFMRMQIVCGHKYCNLHFIGVIEKKPDADSEHVTIELIVQDERQFSVCKPVEKPASCRYFPQTCKFVNGECGLCVVPKISTPSVDANCSLETIAKKVPESKKGIYEILMKMDKSQLRKQPVTVADMHSAVMKHLTGTTSAHPNQSDLALLYKMLGLKAEDKELATLLEKTARGIERKLVEQGQKKSAAAKGSAGRGWHGNLATDEIVERMRELDGEVAVDESALLRLIQSYAIRCQGEHVVKLEIDSEFGEEPSRSDFDAKLAIEEQDAEDERKNEEIWHLWDQNDDQVQQQQVEEMAEDEFEFGRNDRGDLFYVTTPRDLSELAGIGDVQSKQLLVPTDYLSKKRTEGIIPVKHFRIAWDQTEESIEAIRENREIFGEQPPSHETANLQSMLGMSMHKILTPYSGIITVGEDDAIEAYVPLDLIRKHAKKQ